LTLAVQRPCEVTWCGGTSEIMKIIIAREITGLRA
jgi:hypothetical protein